jgi:hypothetical protein
MAQSQNARISIPHSISALDPLEYGYPEIPDLFILSLGTRGFTINQSQSSPLPLLSFYITTGAWNEIFHQLLGVMTQELIGTKEKRQILWNAALEGISSIGHVPPDSLQRGWGGIGEC